MKKNNLYSNYSYSPTAIQNQLMVEAARTNPFRYDPSGMKFAMLESLKQIKIGFKTFFKALCRYLLFNRLNVVMWSLTTILLTAVIVLSGCLYHEYQKRDWTLYNKLSNIHFDVNSRITHEYVRLPDRDAYVPSGQTAIGNCELYANTYVYEVRKQIPYVQPVKWVCELPDGVGHATVQVRNFILDNRFRSVLTIDDPRIQSCIKNIR